MIPAHHPIPQTPPHTSTPTSTPPSPLNPTISRMFLEAARLLSTLPHDPDDPHRRYRVAAYRRGAQAIQRLPEDASLILQRHGLPGLKAIRWIGASLAAAIHEVASTGRWALLDSLRQDLPEYQFYKAIPGLEPAQVIALRDLFGTYPLLDSLRDPARITRLMSLPGLDDPQAAQRVRLMVAGWLLLGPKPLPFPLS